MKHHFWHIQHVFISKLSKKLHEFLKSSIKNLSKFSKFNFDYRNVISTWSSGTGGAGIIGSFSYAGLILIGVTPVNAMLIMLCVPLIEGFAFWILLRNPVNIPKKDSESEFKISPDDTESALPDVPNEMSLQEKINYLPSLLKYMLPLGLVYLFEYFINQGLVRIQCHCVFQFRFFFLKNLFPFKF